MKEASVNLYLVKYYSTYSVQTRLLSHETRYSQEEFRAIFKKVKQEISDKKGEPTIYRCFSDTLSISVVNELLDDHGFQEVAVCGAWDAIAENNSVLHLSGSVGEIAV